MGDGSGGWFGSRWKRGRSLWESGEIPRAGREGPARQPSGGVLAFQFCHGGPAVSRCVLVALAGFTAHLSEVGPAAELELEDERAVGHLVHILALCRGHREGSRVMAGLRRSCGGFARKLKDAAVMKKLLRTSLIKTPLGLSAAPAFFKV